MPDYKAENIKPAWKLQFEGVWPMAVAFVGSHQRLVAGNQDGVLLEWQLPETPVAAKVKDANGKEVDGFETPPPARALVGHTNTITHLAAAPDGRTVISSSFDRTLRIWDLEAEAKGESEVVLDFETRQREARRLPEEKRAEALEAPGVKLPALESAGVLEGHRDWIGAMDLSRNGERLISADDTGLVNVWDWKSRQQVSTWQAPGVAWVVAAALSPDGKEAVVSQYRRKGGDYNNYPAGLRIYNTVDGGERLDILATMFPDEKNPPYQYQYKYSKFVAHGLVAAAWSPDGKLLALGQGGEEGEGKVHLIESESGKLARDVSEHRYGVTDLCFTSDGKYLFTAGRDTTFRILRVEDGQEVAKIGTPRGGQFTDWLSAICLSPDEKWLAAADIGGHVQVWQLG